MATRTRKTSTRRKPAAKPTPQQPEQDPNEVLSIKLLAPVRAYVTIDDQRHFLKLSKDFGVIDRLELERDIDEYNRLWEKGQGKKLTQKDSNRLDEIQDWLFEHVLLRPEKVHEQLDGLEDPETGLPLLSGGLKREIVVAFINAPVTIANALAREWLATNAENQEPESSSTQES